MAYPAAGYLENATRTVAEMKVALEAFLAAARQSTGGPTGGVLQISANGLPAGMVDSSTHGLLSQSGPTDDLESIDYSAVNDGHVVTIYAAGGHTITVQKVGGSGWIQPENDDDVILTGNATLTLQLRSGVWYEIGRTYDDMTQALDHLGAISKTGDTWTNVLEGNVSNGQIRALITGTATPSSTNHAFQAGSTAGANLAIGVNSIHARAGGAASNLLLNLNGGDVRINGSSSDYNVWTKANDGDGSGLDADLLDGYHKSYLLDPPRIRLAHRENPNTDAGGITTSWAARTINHDSPSPLSSGIPGASRSGNQITLSAGTYYIHASAPAFKCNGHQLRLYNITTASEMKRGLCAHSGASDNTATPSVIMGSFELSGTEVLEIQHRAQTARATDGMGAAVNLSTWEKYLLCSIWKVAGSDI